MYFTILIIITICFVQYMCAGILMMNPLVKHTNKQTKQICKSAGLHTIYFQMKLKQKQYIFRGNFIISSCINKFLTKTMCFKLVKKRTEFIFSNRF